MCTPSGHASNEALGYSAFPDAMVAVECALSPPDESYVPLEIQAGTLRRLIAQHALVIEEVHCLHGQTKHIIKQALLDHIIYRASD